MVYVSNGTWYCQFEPIRGVARFLHTNVYMGLLPLEHCCQSTDAIAILGEYLLDGVCASLLAEGKLAGPDKGSKGSRKSRHCEEPFLDPRIDKELHSSRACGTSNGTTT